MDSLVLASLLALPPSATALVLGEVQVLITAMRRNRKWKSGPLDYQSHHRHQLPFSLIHALDTLRWRLTTTCTVTAIDALSLIQPFIDVISSPETDGSITTIALQSLSRFIAHTPSIFDSHSLTVPPSHCREAIHRLVQSLNHCRYESTETAKDELVLLELLSLVIKLLSSPSLTVQLSIDDSEIWMVLKTCYRIYRYMRPPDYSELLCQQAEETIIAIIRIVVRRLQDDDVQRAVIHTRAVDHSSSSNVRAGYGYAAVLRIFEFMCTLAEISHADVGFAYSISQGLPVPPYLSNVASVPANDIEALSPTHQRSASEQNYFPSRRVKLPSNELLDLGVLTLQPPPLSLPSSHFSSPAALNKSLSDWYRRTIFTTRVLLTAFESGQHHCFRFPSLVSLIEDSVCKFILRNCRTSHAMLYTITLRTFYLLMRIGRERLSMQQEVIFNTVYLRVIGSKTGAQSSALSSTAPTPSLSANHPSFDSAYEIKELTLESLLDFTRSLSFFSEFYINYDCSPTASNLYENLFRSLCKSIFPVHGLMTGNHMLALKCLLQCFRSMKHRLKRQHTHTQNHRASDSSSDSQLITDPSLCLLSDLRATRLYKRILQSCVDEFNKKAKRGLAAMQLTLGLFTNYDRLKATINRKDDLQYLTTVDREELKVLARFLRFTPGLDKTAVGQFIAEPGPISQLVLDGYVSLFDFHSVSLDDALRMFLEAFRLPVEAQQIDRVMQAFANHYHSHHPSLLANADVVHTLSFSLIMLNTDAHNELIKNKMTLEQFVANNRGINAGENIPRPLLEGLYHTIKRKEIKMSGEGLTGEVNDALWNDLLLMAKIHEKRPFIKSDQQSVSELSAKGVMAGDIDREVAGQVVNGHHIGRTIYQPPISVPFQQSPAAHSVNGDHIHSQSQPLTESPVVPSRQVTLTELTRTMSAPADTNTNTSITASSPLYTAPSPLSSPVYASLSALDFDMLMEGWNPAIAALSMVFDQIRVNSEGHASVVDGINSVNSENAEDVSEGWDKVEMQDTVDGISNGMPATPSGSNNGNHIEAHSNDRSSSHTQTSASEENDSGLLSLLKDGFTTIASIAASYHQCQIVDKVIATLCKFTGLINDYRADEHSGNSHSPSTAVGIGGSVTQHRNNVSLSLQRFASNAKCRWALSLALSLVHTHHDHIREAWKDILQCLLQLFAIGLAPLSMLALDDHVGWLASGRERMKGRSELLLVLSCKHGFGMDEENERQSTVSALLSSMSSYFSFGMTSPSPALPSQTNTGTSGNGQYQSAKSPEFESAERLCAATLSECDFPALLSDAKIMQPQALRVFVEALLSLTPLPQIAALPLPVNIGTSNNRSQRGKKSLTNTAVSVRGTGASRIIGGASVGAGYEVTVSDEDLSMTSDSIYKHRPASIEEDLNKDVALANIETLFPSKPSAVSDGRLTGGNFYIELQRLLLCHQLIITVLIHNYDRIDALLPVVQSHLHTVLHSLTLAPLSAAQTQSLGRSVSNPSLPQHSTQVTARSNGILDSRSVTPAPPLVSITPTPTSKRSSFSALPTVLTAPLPPVIVESALTVIFSLIHRLPLSALQSADFLSLLPSLSLVDMSHKDCASQLVGGLLSLLEQHPQRLLSPHFSTVTELLSNASLYHHTFGLGLQCLQQIATIVDSVSDSESGVSVMHGWTMKHYMLLLQCAESYVQSRWCSPLATVQCCQFIQSVYERINRVIQQTDSNGERNHLLQHGLFETPIKLRLNRADAASPPHPSAPSLLAVSEHLWRDLCLPMFSSLVTIISSISARIRVLHAAHVRASRTGASNVNSAGFIDYIQGFGRAQRRALQSLRQILINDEFPTIIADMATHQALSHTPSLSSSSDIALASTVFWHHCLDQLIFPLLSSLTFQHAVDLELSEGLTAIRSQSISLLEKIFLLHLPQLLLIDSGRGFHQCWLRILKLMDAFMQLGVKRETILAQHKRKSIYDRKPAHSHGTDDSETLLTESVEEAIKNFLLVLNSNGIFSDDSVNVSNNELWNLTWDIVEPVFPQLKTQLFQPVNRNESAAVTAAAAPTPPRTIVCESAAASSAAQILDELRTPAPIPTMLVAVDSSANSVPAPAPTPSPAAAPTTAAPAMESAASQTDLSSLPAEQQSASPSDAAAAALLPSDTAPAVSPGNSSVHTC